jgi:hypothetical protein
MVVSFNQFERRNNARAIASNFDPRNSLEESFLKHISRPSWGLLKYLDAVSRMNGWLCVSVRFLSRKYGRAQSTVKRWLGELFSAGYLRSEKHGRRCRTYTVLIPHTDTSERQLSLYEPLEYVSPTEKQHHRDDVESENSEAIRKAAGFERLSEGDRRYLKELQRSGVAVESIRAGVLVGRARRMCSEHNWAAEAAKWGRRHEADPIRSLRYFAGPIAEQFPSGYADYMENWLRRHTA